MSTTPKPISGTARPRRMTIPDIRSMKGTAPIACLTAYTAPVAKLLDPHVDLLLVGDSLGMVIYGEETTLGVDLDTMIRHGRAVVNASSQALVVVDMPFASYQESRAQAFRNAARVMAETGCAAVKVEGGAELADTIRYLTSNGIPVMGHVGLMPQRLHAITGRRPPPDLLRRLHDRPFLALAAVPQTQSLRAGDCSCPANTAPEGMVVCQVQTRTTGSRIAPIDYLAADADGDPLSGVFTHQRGIDPIQPGLPAPLTSTCTADPGALLCTITGNAPDQASDLQLMLAVSDGAATLNLVSLLEVAPRDGGLVFFDGFETPVCP